MWGIKLIVLRVLLHTVTLSSAFTSGTVRVGVRDQIPVAGVELILGNDLAGVKVFPSLPEVKEPAVDACKTTIYLA